MKIDLKNIVCEINKLSTEFQHISNDGIRAQINEIEKSLSSNKSNSQLNIVLPIVYAIVKEVARRFTLGDIEVTASEKDKEFYEHYDFIEIFGDKAIYHNHWYVLNEEIKWDMIHFDEQILAGIYLHQGKAVEMATGEGKTLAATMPVVLNGLTHKGVHVMTSNDYLSKRDCELLRPFYMFFGLSVDCLEYLPLHDILRKDSYKKDVVFGTNSSFIFDYLYDHLSTSPEECVQKNHYYSIIDEMDSILIDDAQTPYIISGDQIIDMGELYKRNKVVIEELLKDNTLYEVNESTRNCRFTKKGKKWLAKKCGIPDLYEVAKLKRDNIHLKNLTEEQKEILNKLELQNSFYQLLYAYTLLERDVDYIVSSVGEILIIDKNTGRLKKSSRWDFGRHTAVEAKENVRLKLDYTSEALISLKNYFRLYDKICGMSGTLLSCADELKDSYNLDIGFVPTHRDIIRKDEPIRIFKTKQQKYSAIIQVIKNYHKIGRPILVACLSIKQAEELHKILYDDDINANLLTAKSLEKEAFYISQAGYDNAITIATSLAGRGTDIKLTEKARECGGLVVIGVDLFSSVRVDRQLMGRAGRQGDPGTSIFFVSLEDRIINCLNKEDKQKLELLSKQYVTEELDNQEIRTLVKKAQSNQERKSKAERYETSRKDDIIAPFRKDFYDFRNKVLFDASYANRLIFEVLQNKNSFSQSYINEHIRSLYRKVRRLLTMYSTNNYKKENFSVPFSDNTHLFVVKLNIKEALNDFEYFKKEYERQVILEVYDKYWKRFIAYVNTQLDKSEIEELLKTVDIRSPKTVISVHFSYSLPMAMQIY